jgi:hypothetical protein
MSSVHHRMPHPPTGTSREVDNPPQECTRCHTVKVFHSKDMKFLTIFLHYK